MTTTSISGPLFVWGQGAPIVAGSTPPSGGYNADLGPSGVAIGTFFPDSRYPLQNGAASTTPTAVGFFNGGGLVCIDQAPSTAATANIAALANVSNLTAMTLVSTSGGGITVSTAATFILQTGLTVPSGALIIDTAPALITFGQNKSMQIVDARTTIARAVSITGTSGGAGGHFIVTGYDLYGQLQTENINATSGATTTNGAKGWKFITSVVPQFTDTHNYSVGTADIFEFPVAVYEFFAAEITWNNASITANTGFVAAVTTTPSATTGSVRGTYAVQSASDGTKKLQVVIEIMPWNAASLNGTTSVFGQVPA